MINASKGNQPSIKREVTTFDTSVRVWYVVGESQKPSSQNNGVSLRCQYHNEAIPYLLVGLPQLADGKNLE